MAKRSSNKSKRRSPSTGSRTRSSKPATPISPDLQAAASSDAATLEGSPSPDSRPGATDEPKAAQPAENMSTPVEVTSVKSASTPTNIDLDSLETAIARGQDLLTRLEAARQQLETKVQGWSNGDDSLPSQQEMTEAIDYLGKTVVQLEATVKAKADPQAIALNTESIVNLHDQVSQLERQFAAASESNPADDAIAPLHTQLNELENRLETAQQTRSELATLRSNLESLQAKVKKLPDARTAIAKVQTNLQKHIEGLQNQLDALSAEDASPDTFRQDVDRRLNELSAQLDTEQRSENAIATLRADIERQIETLRARLETIPDPSEAMSGLQTDLSTVRETLDRLAGAEYLAKADFEPWQQTLQELQESAASLPDAEVVSANAAAIDRLQAVSQTLEDLATRASEQEISLSQQAEALAQLGPVVLDLQRQLSSLAERDNPAIASLTQQMEALESNLTSFADRQTINEHADAIAHLQTQLNILPDPSADIRTLHSRLESADGDRAGIQQAIATLRAHLERKADSIDLTDRTVELAQLTERVEAVSTSGERAATRLSELQAELNALAAWKAEFGDQLSPAEMLVALDFLGQKITQYEAELTRLDSHAHADVEAAIATVRNELSVLSPLADDIVHLRSQQAATATTTDDLTQADIELRALVDTLSTRTATVDNLHERQTELAEAIATCRAEIETIADWKQQFGDQLSPAEMLEALDFLGQTITQYEANITHKPDRAELQSLADEVSARASETNELHAQQAKISQAIAACRTDIATLTDWRQQFGDRLSPANLLEALNTLSQSMTEVETTLGQTATKAELQTLSARIEQTSTQGELHALSHDVQTRQTAQAEAIASCQAEISNLQQWKHQFGNQLSPAEMLEALDFLGQTITQYEPQLARKADAEAVKLNTETLMGVQTMLSELRVQFQQLEERPGQNEIAIASLTQKLATAGHTNERQAEELRTQAVEINRLTAQLVQTQSQLAPEQLRRSLEATGWSPERIAKIAKHMQSLAQAQTTLRRWSIAIGCAALGAISLALSSVFGLLLG